MNVSMRNTEHLSKYGFLVFLVLCALLPFVSSAKEGCALNTELVSRLHINNREISRSDKLRVAAIIRNTGSAPLYIENRPHPYAVTHIKMYDATGMELRSYLTIIFEIAPPRKEDFVDLRPDDEISMSFVGTLQRRTIPDIRKGEGATVEGLFLDFGASSILLPKNGTYDLTFELESRKDFAESIEEQFGLHNVWHGKLVSKPVQITISE